MIAIHRWCAGALALSLAAASAALGQGSAAAVRFHGTAAGQQDRARIPVDDDLGGPDQSEPADVGAGSFTAELWLKGSLAANATGNAGGDVALPGAAWESGNVLLDRSILAGSGAEWAVSIAGGYVRFFTGTGDQVPLDPGHTLEGDHLVLDGAWHHVAVTRDAATGVKAIYVDGDLDVASAAGASHQDLSHPNAGVAGNPSPWGPYLVVGAPKDGGGPAHPAFAGSVDELRLWNRARTVSEILGTFDRAIAGTAAGLVGSYRFEEGAGTVLADSSAAQSAPGALIAGIAGNGEWATYAQAAANTAPVSFGQLPPGFQRSLVVDQLVEPTSFGFLPDGRILIGERSGRIRVVQGGALLPLPLIEIPTNTEQGERGLLGLAVHPDFAANGWVYVFYTTPEPRDRVARFTVAGNVASPSSEVLIWQNTHPAPDWHHAGCIRFDAEAKLWISTGDQYDAANAQDLTVQDGKLLRLNDDGTVPADNPFVGAPGVPPSIYAYGLRNPFRFTVDPPSGRVWIGDVGGNLIDSWEEVNLALPGANYGWPDQEGLACYAADCSPFHLAEWSYQHTDPDYYIVNPQGSVTAGPVYRASAFPAAYQGNLFLGDYSNRFIRRLILDQDGGVVADPIFLAPPFAGTPVDLAVGPDGALYFLTYGVFVGGLPDSATLQKIEWVGSSNAAPIAAASATPAAGLPPLAVQFSSAGSFDPDAAPQALAYAWDFGDGAVSTQQDPSHVYAVKGLYQARLTVSDGQLSATSAPLAIEVGGKPVALIAAPAQGAKYTAGQVVPFQGSGTDPEDGPLAPAALTWQVLLVHHEHVHPFLGPITGSANGSFTVPAVGHPPADTHFEIALTAVDSNGLSTTTSVAIYPKASALGFATAPSGIVLTVDEESLPTPAIQDSVVGFLHQVAAPQVAVLGGQTYGFQCWSDGGAAEHAVEAPLGALNLTAVYAPLSTVVALPQVAAAAHNAEHSPATGQQFAAPGDPLALRLGRNAAGALQLGLEFALAVPQGATILAAELELTAAAGSSGQATALVRAYDVATAPAFSAGLATPLTGFAPLGSDVVLWNVPAAAPGAEVDSPDLAELVQGVVDRPDFASGNRIGLVLDGGATAGLGVRAFRNFGSGTPARLRVTWALAPAAGGGCTVPCGFSSYGLGAAPTHVLGLAGGGQPKVGGLAVHRLVGLGSAPGAYFFVSLTSGNTPFYGGRLLIGGVGFVASFFLPAFDGETGFSVLIPNQPSLAGAITYMQAIAPDPSQPLGAAFSNGLATHICPP